MPHDLAVFNTGTSQELIEQAAESDTERLDRYSLVRDYYMGEHKTMLTARIKTFLENNSLSFADNFCETVIDTMVSRLDVNGITHSNEATQDWLSDIWAFDLEHLQNTVHHETALLGDTFLAVGWNHLNGSPTFSVNRAEGCKAVYFQDNPDTLHYIAKKWTTSTIGPLNPKGHEIERLNIYFDSRLEKYYRLANGGDWAQWLDNEDTMWPVPLLDAGSVPLGIPIFHFRNKPRTFPYGRSEIMPVIPLNDFINKTWVDLALIMDSMGYGRPWIAGVDDASDYDLVPGEIMTHPDKDTKFGMFPADSPEGALRVIEKIAEHIGSRSSTPVHHLILTQGAPSGESMKTAESSLVAKIKDRQGSYGAVWSKALEYAVKLGRLNSVPVVDDRIKIEWEDPQSRNESENMDTMLKYKSIGVSNETLMTMAGFDPEVEKERKSKEQTNIGAAVLRNFDRGEMGDETE